MSCGERSYAGYKALYDAEKKAHDDDVKEMQFKVNEANGRADFCMKHHKNIKMDKDGNVQSLVLQIPFPSHMQLFPSLLALCVWLMLVDILNFLVCVYFNYYCLPFISLSLTYALFLSVSFSHALVLFPPHVTPSPSSSGDWWCHAARG